MKIFILAKEPFPQGMAATNRISRYAQGLVAIGVDCEVVIAVRTEVHRKVKNYQSQGITEADVKFRYIPPTTNRSARFIQRRIDDFCDNIRLLIWVKQNVKQGDVVLFYPFRDILLTRLIVKICHKKGGRIVRELCELPYGTVSDSFMHKSERFVYEKWVMPRFDGFIAISEALNTYARKAGGINSSIVKVPILIDINQYEGIVPHKQSKPYIFHAGTMYERKDAIVSTMKAFAEANKVLKGNVDFILAGPESPHKQELTQIISDNNLNENVRFLGQLTHQEVLCYQKGAWLTILNKHDNLQNQNGFSTKLGDVLLAGTPVITTTVGEANNFLKDGVSALIVEPHNIQAVADAIVKAYSNPQLLEKISCESQRIAQENFDYRIHGKRLKEFFEQITYN